MSYTISKKTITNIFTDLLEKKSVNKALAIEAIITHVNDYALEYIIDMLSSKDKVELIQIKDYVKVPINTYHVDRHFNYDVLNEMGLLCEETGSVYGRVTGDASWNSDYNPFYGRLKVALFYHDKEGQFMEYEESINTVSVTKLNKLDIPYFKGLEHGKNITPPIEIRDTELGNNQENVLTAD